MSETDIKYFWTKEIANIQNRSTGGFASANRKPVKNLDEDFEVGNVFCFDRSF